MAVSSGILVFRQLKGKIEFFLVHPGGPFFIKRDEGWWTIPKGLVEDGEDLLATAQREFHEETGHTVTGNFIDLGRIVQKGGKHVHCFAVEADLDASAISSNTFELEWPPRSGKKQVFEEVDRAEWFDLGTARRKINEKQAELLSRLVNLLAL